MTCPHLGHCGGCSFTAPYPEQLDHKRAQLASLLDMPEMDVPPVVRSPRDVGFRQKAAFTFGTDRAGTLVMGHYAAGSNRVNVVQRKFMALFAARRGSSVTTTISPCAIASRASVMECGTLISTSRPAAPIS